MREIKFRGKDLNTGEWCYGGFSRTTKHCHPTITELRVRNKKVAYCKIAIEDDTLGQFIGLFDKNGKLIFEGDIMKLPTSKDVGVVEWNSVLCRFQLSWQNKPIATNIFIVEKSGGVVIGNIHDNPELLKGGEK